MNKETIKFIALFNSKVTAWYLNSRDDYSSCDTCGEYDKTKPEREDIERLIEETLIEMGFKQ